MRLRRITCMLHLSRIVNQGKTMRKQILPTISMIVFLIYLLSLSHSHAMQGIQMLQSGLPNLDENTAPSKVTVDSSMVVNIPDAKLRAVIEDSLGKASGVPITAAEMATLTRLILAVFYISDLTGLEFATSLTVLELPANRVSDISPLSGLTNLTVLELGQSSISDISPLSGLTNLTELNVWSNNISDISPLSGLTNLTELTLTTNSISDISPLSGLTNLTVLKLGQNSISDISLFSGLTNLTELALYTNNISDISSLLGLTNLTKLYLAANGIFDISPLSGLTHLTVLSLSSNSISDISPLSGLTHLIELRLYDTGISDISLLSGLTNLTELSLGINSISDILPLSGLTNLTVLQLGQNSISDISLLSGLTNLTSLYLADNGISDISSLSGLTNLRWLDLNTNSISDISPLVNNLGLSDRDYIDIRNNPLSLASITTHIPALWDRGARVKYGGIVTIPDANLHAAILDALGKSPSTSITVTDMANLITLDASNRNIRDLDLTGLEFATSLTELNLVGNSLSSTSITTHIPALQNRGVKVLFGIPATLVNISDDEQKGVPGAVLGPPLVVEVRDQDGNVLEGATAMFAVTAGDGSLSVETAMTDSRGRVSSVLTLGNSLEPITVSVLVAGIDQPVTFSVKAMATPDFDGDGDVDFADFLLLLAQIGFSEEDEGYEARFDLDGDGTIGFADFLIFANVLGKVLSSN